MTVEQLGNVLSVLGSVAGNVTCIAAMLTLCFKPLRERLLGLGAIRDGQKCIIRAEILRLYYRHQEAENIRQYEYENLVQLYLAYKALGGNSFVDHIYKEMQDWTVVP